MIRKQLLTTAITTATLFGSYAAHAQGMAVNTTGASANASAILDVQSTTQGVLVPKMTTTQRTSISSPATGLLVWDNTIGGFYFYNGSAWVSLSSPTGTISSGDLTGSYPNPTLVTTGVTANTYGSATTSPTIAVDAKGRITSASNTPITGVTPGGTIASGDLAGSSYPNPTVASGAITGTKIASATITSGNIASATVTGSNIAASTITSTNIAAHTITTVNLPSGATSTTFLRGDNTWVTPSGGGLSISVNTQLSGSSASVTGSLSGFYPATDGAVITLPSASTAGQTLIFVDVTSTGGGGSGITIKTSGSDKIYDGIYENYNVTSEGGGGFYFRVISDGSGKWWGW